MGTAKGPVLLEGFVAGLIGYVVVILFHGIAGVVVGNSALSTVKALGTAMVGADPGGGSAGAMLAFNGVHLMVFLVIGLVAAALIAFVERHLALWYGVFFLFIASFIWASGWMVAFAIGAPGVASPALIMAGDAAAALAMGLYFLHAHSRLWQAIDERGDPDGAPPLNAGAAHQQVAEELR